VTPWHLGLAQQVEAAQQITAAWTRCLTWYDSLQSSWRSNPRRWQKP
jgi:hypothetical protein